MTCAPGKITAFANRDREKDKRTDERGPVISGQSAGSISYENEDRMSELSSRFRTLTTALVFSAGVIVAGCSGDAGDRGADRSQQQSEQLQDRIKTTQIDR